MPWQVEQQQEGRRVVVGATKGALWCEGMAPMSLVCKQGLWCGQVAVWTVLHWQ